MSRYCPLCDANGIVSKMLVTDVGDGDFITGQEFYCEHCSHQIPLDEVEEREELPRELSRLSND